MTFLVDSGATEHIINKGFILRNFKKCTDSYNRSANKNESADIRIDGKGELYLNKLDESGKTIKLTNIIAAKDISENRLSLRLFADAGFGIYLDSEALSIFKKETGIELFSGFYEKQN